MDDDFWLGVIIGTFISFVIGVMVMWGVAGDIPLSQEAGNDVCVNLTGNTSATAVYSGEYKLVCEIPSYDHTTNIIVRKAGEKDEN